MGILPVDAEMETFGQEGHTGGVAIDSVEAKMPPAVAVVAVASITLAIIALNFFISLNIFLLKRLQR